MVESNELLERIERIATAFGELLPDVVFVGGAVVQLYDKYNIGENFRPTKDIDCTFKIKSYKAYAELEEKLRQKGFMHLKEPDAPICRWRYNDILVDIMPTDPEVLGFSSTWIKRGFSHSVYFNMPNGTDIRILSLPYFLAAKLEAYKTRGSDPRYSEDFEDVVTILDFYPDPSEVFNDLPKDVGEFIRYVFTEIDNDFNLSESVFCHLNPGLLQKERYRSIFTSITAFIDAR